MPERALCWFSAKGAVFTAKLGAFAIGSEGIKNRPPGLIIAALTMRRGLTLNHFSSPKGPDPQLPFRFRGSYFPGFTEFLGAGSGRKRVVLDETGYGYFSLELDTIDPYAVLP